MKLTQKKLKELLHYDPETGVFTWLMSRPGIKPDRVAGGINKIAGYRLISVDRKLYRASRLAWLYMEGYFPENDVDHEDRIRNNDKWDNLRHVSHQCNSRNCNISKNNNSGIMGVSWIKERKKWYANIMISGKTIGLGRFKSKLNAAKARWNAEVKHGFPNCNTTSSAYQYLKKEGAICHLQ